MQNLTALFKSTLIIFLLHFSALAIAADGGKKKNGKHPTVVTLRLSNFTEPSDPDNPNSPLINASPNDNINDNVAFQKAAAAIQSHCDQNLNEPIELIIDRPLPGKYWIVGYETSGPSSTEPFYRSQQIFKLTNCKYVTIKGEGNELPLTLIRMADKMHMGLFGFYGELPPTPDAWNILQGNSCQNVIDYINGPNNPNPPAPNQGIGCPVTSTTNTGTIPYLSQHLIANPRQIFTFIDCTNLVLQDLEVDGNSTNMILGGEYSIGTHPYELANRGIYAIRVKAMTLNNLHIHHMGLDGLEIANAVLQHDGAQDEIVISDCSFNNNGRNGISWTGGNGLKMTKSDCNYNANPTLRIRSSPGSGIDFEPEAQVGVPHNATMNGFFQSCNFLGNGGDGGVVMTYDTMANYSGRHTFISCDMGNTSNASATVYSYAALINQSACQFSECNFYGLTFAPYEHRGPVDWDPNFEYRLHFANSLFTDCYNGNLVNIVPQYNTWIDSKKAIMEKCNFKTYNPLRFYTVRFGQEHIHSNDPDDFMLINGCTFTKYNMCGMVGTYANVVAGALTHSIIKNSRFRMHRAPNAINSNPYFYMPTAVIPVPVNGSIDGLDGNTEDHNYAALLCDLDCSRPTAPTITASDTTTICAGYHLVLNGNTAGGAWYNGAQPLNLTTPSITITQSGDYYVMVRDECEDSVSSNHIAVTVNPLPTPSIITSDPPAVNGTVTVCEGSVVTLSTNQAGTWNEGSTTTNLLVTSSGDYFVNSTNECGIVSSNVIHVTINPLPVGVSAGGPYSNLSVNASPITLTGAPVGGIFSGAGVSGNTFDPSVAGVGTHTITYSYTNNNGCTATGTATITVDACNFSVGNGINGPVNVCLYREPYTANAIYSIAAVDAGSYTWTVSSGSNTFTGQGTSSISVHFPTGFISGYVTVTVVNGCTGAQTVRSLSVNTNPPGSLGSINGPAVNNACLYIGQPDQTYSIATIPDADQYNWTITGDAQIVSGANTTTATVHFNQNFNTATISVQASSQCGSSPVRSLVIGKILASKPSPIQGPNNVCNYVLQNSTVTYSVNAQPEANYFIWTLPVGATNITYPTTESVSFKLPANFTTGTISVVAVNGCGTSASQSLVLKTAPSLPAEIFGNTNPCPSSTETYSVAQVANFTYNWIVTPTTTPLPVEIISGQGTNTVSVQFNSNWTGGSIKVRAITDCAASSYRTKTLGLGDSCTSRISHTGIAVSAEASPKKLIYPNPSNGNFSIVLDKFSKTCTAAVEIVNSYGAVVYRANKTCNDGVMKLNLNNKLIPGFYMISYVINGEKRVEKLVIEK